MPKGRRARREIEVREYREADIPAIARLYYDTVHRINARDYSPRQIKTWAPAIEDQSFWQARFKGYRVFVAEHAGIVTGFAEFELSGHIDCFYVHHAWQRQGVGGRLMARIEREAQARRLARLFADVSLTARPFFEKMGFRVIKAQTKRYRGVAFDQYVMERRVT